MTSVIQELNPQMLIYIMLWLLFTEPPVPSKEKQIEQESMQTSAQTSIAEDDKVQSDPGQSTKPTVGMFHRQIDINFVLPINACKGKLEYVQKKGHHLCFIQSFSFN